MMKAVITLCLQIIVQCYSKPCHSEGDSGDSSIICSAVVYKSRNCSELFLSEQHPHLYDQIYWPDKPYNLQLVPVQDVYKGWLYPGFQVKLYPPRSASIRYIKGFQLDYGKVGEDTTECIIIEIQNKTLDSEHRDINLRFITKIWPLNGNFWFKAWSLPKSPPNEANSYQKRFGNTGLPYIKLDPAQSAGWITTISYFNNMEDRYIQIWFVPAPEEYKFLYYNVSLVKIIANAATDLEERITVERTGISQTMHVFENVAEGIYRASVFPFDDKSQSLSECKCRSNNGCGSCTKTVTALIYVQDVRTSTSSHTSTVTSVSATQTSHFTSTKNSEDVIAIETKAVNKHVIPSITGAIAFVLVICVIVGCYKLRRGSSFSFNLGEQRIHAKQTDYERHIAFPSPRQSIGPDKKVTVLLANVEDDKSHSMVVQSFAKVLQDICNVNVLFYPWTIHEDKFRWVTNMIQDADFIIFPLSRSAIIQYKSWITDNQVLCPDLFLFILKTVLNGLIKDPTIRNKLIIVKFEHTKHLEIPRDLSMDMKDFLLNDEFTQFLCYIHGISLRKVDRRLSHLPTKDDLESTVVGRNLNVAIQQARCHCRLSDSSSSGDSGFRSENGNRTSSTSEISSGSTFSDLQYRPAFRPPSILSSDNGDATSEDIGEQIIQFNNRNI